MRGTRNLAATVDADADDLSGFGSKLFVKRWLAHPLKVGSVIPSGQALARKVARRTKLLPDQVVLEVGAGTGPVTMALLEAGIPAERLFVVEIDRDMCRFLRAKFPQAQVIEGDCTKLREIIPAEWHGKISTIVSGIPMLPLPFEVQKAMLDSFFDVMAPGGKILQYTYSVVSPLPLDRHKLKGRREAFAVLNVPPAWVWSYERAA